MAKKISELTAAGTLTGTEQLEVTQGGASRRTTLADLPVSTAVQTALDGKFDKTGGAITGNVLVQDYEVRAKQFAIGVVPPFSMFLGTDQRFLFFTDSAPAQMVGGIASDSFAPLFGTARCRGSYAAPAIVQAGDSLGNMTTRVCYEIDGGGVPLFRNASLIRVVAAETPTSTTSPSSIEFHNTRTGNGATSLALSVSASGAINPGADNAQDFGIISLRWREFFCGNATINTSDSREKTAVRPLTDSERAAARDLISEIGIYQFLTSVKEKGEDGARLHEGMTVQRAIEVMESHGLDPMRYGFICYDQWPESVEEIEDENGDMVRIVPRQAMRETVTEVQAVEIIDGTPTLVTRQHTERTPVAEMRPVVTAEGEPVVGEDGEPIMHPVPVMEDTEQRYRRVVTPAGDRYSFRETRLIMFMLAGLL